MGGSSLLPLPTPENRFLPFHQSFMCESVQSKTSVNTDSGLAFNLPTTVNATTAAVVAATRKRSRDSFNQFNTCNTMSFVGDDILPLIQQHQCDIDRIISLHTIITKVIGMLNILGLAKELEQGRNRLLFVLCFW